MIDPFRRAPRGSKLHPADKDIASSIVVGYNSSKFSSPKQVATAEEQNSDTSTTGHIVSGSGGQKPTKNWFARLSKKQWTIIAGVAILVIGGGIAIFLTMHKSKPPVVSKPKPMVQAEKKIEQPTSNLVPSTLSGVPVDPAVNNLPVTAVMIENSTDARPQSGLNAASVVFEAVAEGGITRFLTLFQDTMPDYVGPVRSVRPYYIQWALGFDAPIAHAGGSAEALADMKAWNVKDLNDSKSYFSRISYRAAPHNLYTSMAKLHEYEAAKGYGKSTFTGFVRKAEQPSTVPTARAINFTISSATFNVHYDYDATHNAYLRSEGGKPHTDEKSGAVLSPKVVIALVMPQSNKGIYSVYGTIGSGQMYVFQDGVVTTGTWRKDSNTSQFVFTNTSGTPLALNPGQTWITVLGSASRIVYTP